MSEREIVKAGTWVELTRVVLESAERPDTVPEETRRTDLLLRVRGWLVEDALPGGEASIRTLADRVLTGRLTDVRPRFGHDFGEPVDELLDVGREIRQELRELLAGETREEQP